MGIQVADLFAKLGLQVDEAQWQKGTNAINYLKAAAVGLGTYFSGKAIFGLVTEVTQLSGHLDDLSQQTGVSTDSLQELGFAAKLSGSDMETLVGGLKKLSGGLVDAAKTGKGPIVDTLKVLGISIADVKGKLEGEGGFDDILGSIADGFSQMEPGVKKTSYAMDLFGKSGATLIPFLNNGSKGIEELRAKAHELGVVMDKNTVKSMADMDDQVDSLHFAWQGLKQSIATTIAPLLLPALNGLIGVLARASAWIRDHSEQIQEYAHAAWHALTETIDFVGEVLDELADIVNMVIDGVEEFIDRIVDAWNFLVDIAQSIIDFFKRTLSFLRPLGQQIYSLFRFMADRFRDAWDAISDTAAGVRDKLLEIGGKIRDVFVEAATAIRDGFSSAFDFIIEKAGEVLKAVRNIPGFKQVGGFIGRGTGALVKTLSGGDVGNAEGAYGNAVAQGLVDPEEESEAHFNARRNAGIATSGGSASVSGSSKPSTTNITTVSADITVNPPPGSDPAAIAKMVDDRLQTHVQNAAED